MNRLIISLLTDQLPKLRKWGGTSRCRPMIRNCEASRQSAQFGLVHVLVGELIVGGVELLVENDTLEPRSLRIDDLLVDRVLAQLRRQLIPGLELLEHDAVRR